MPTDHNEFLPTMMTNSYYFEEKQELKCVVHKEAFPGKEQELKCEKFFTKKLFPAKYFGCKSVFVSF